MQNRVISVMGDGGFWHNGFTSGVVNAVYNNQDSVLVILKNGYTSATGTQAIASSPTQPAGKTLTLDIETALKGVGVQWIRKITSYNVAEMRDTLHDAMTTNEGGLKVIIADGECQLERQRRVKPINAAKLKRGERVVRTRFGIDDDVCTGDHSCIRLSGCPSPDHQTQSQSAADRPCRHRQPGLCGLWPLRRERTRSHSLSFFLQG